MKAAVRIEDLERWAAHGAIWRPLAVSDEQVIVELCTCYGERVDTGQSDDPDLIRYVRGHREE